MLTSTFVHVHGIGYITERKIWDMGVYSWDQFLKMHDRLDLPENKKELILPRIEESIDRLKCDDHAFFARALASKDHWRALSEFGKQVAYLDIETTGCNYDDQITVIGLYDGYDMQTFIQGINLHEFPQIISNYKMLVTFFGSGFDIPFIKRTFPNIEINHLHIDLCFMLKRLGFSGGLKRIEKELNIKRRPETEGLDGFDAVRLWNEYRRGSRESLELLTLYNREDVVNMESLLSFGYSQMKNSLILPESSLIQLKPD